MLQAFAYWESTPSGGFRRGTLLVGNGDERIVGNAVLKNPGSAYPLELESKRKDGRLRFSVDQTMYALAELFNLGKGGGTVRIFNLSDIREANFSKASRLIAASDIVSEDVATIIEEGPAVSTYLGWGELYKNPKLRPKAESIFEVAKKNTPSLRNRIDENPFIHPLYLMRYGRSKDICIEEVRRFLEGKKENGLYHNTR